MKLFRKNQIIITVLIALIAIAGYLNYVDNNAKQAIKETETTTDGESDNTPVDVSDISEGDDIAQANDKVDDEKNGENETTGDIYSNDADIVSNPGEAVIVSGNTANINFAIEARLSREQIRTNNKELLLNLINNQNVSEEEKQEVVDQLIKLTQDAEAEDAAETLLEAKGFENSVVNITNDGVSVIVSELELTDVKIAQIEDVIKNKTGVSVANITIANNYNK